MLRRNGAPTSSAKISHSLCRTSPSLPSTRVQTRSESRRTDSGPVTRDFRPVDRPPRRRQPRGMNKQRRWADTSPGTQAAIAVAGVAQFGLLGAALVDITRREPDQIKGPRWAWVMASFVNFIGPIAYFAVGRRRARQ